MSSSNHPVKWCLACLPQTVVEHVFSVYLNGKVLGVKVTHWFTETYDKRFRKVEGSFQLMCRCDHSSPATEATVQHLFFISQHSPVPTSIFTHQGFETKTNSCLLRFLKFSCLITYRSVKHGGLRASCVVFHLLSSIREQHWLNFK